MVPGARVDDHGAFGDLGHGEDAPAPPQVIVGGEGAEPLLQSDDRRIETRIIDRRAHHRHIAVPFEEPGSRRVVVDETQVRKPGRCPALPGPLQRGGVSPQRSPGVPEPEFPVPLAEHPGEPVGLGKHPTRLREDAPPGLGEFAAVRDATEELVTDSFLEGRHRPRHRRLGHEQA